MKGYGFGLLGNIVVGIVGSFIGGWLLNTLGIFPGGGILGAIIGATAGAVLLLLPLSLGGEPPAGGFVGGVAT